jgi:hypothetical protein
VRRVVDPLQRRSLPSRTLYPRKACLGGYPPSERHGASFDDLARGQLSLLGDLLV